MAVRKALKAIEPRPVPTKTKVQEIMIDGRLWARHVGWECPVCGEYCRRNDRSVRHRHGSEIKVDYSGYNMHWAANHATPFWREQNIIRTVKRHLKNGA